MSNRILSTTLEQKRLSNALAELWIHVEVDQFTATTELRGRFTGPKCPELETVQIAYPLRPLSQDDCRLKARIVIPEPNLWTLETPYIYEGNIELWQDGQRCDIAVVIARFKK
jgi:hypothetical protein